MNTLKIFMLPLLSIFILSCGTKQEQNTADMEPEELPAPVAETVDLPAVEIAAESAAEQQALEVLTAEQKQELADLQKEIKQLNQELEQIKAKYPKMKSTLMEDAEGTMETVAGNYKPSVEGIDDPMDYERYILLLEKRFDNRKQKREKFVKNQETPVEPKDSYQAIFERIQDELQYPEIAVEREIEGTVLVRFDVDEQGNVDEAMVTDGIEYQGDMAIAKAFNASAVVAVRSTSGMWKPAKQGDRPIATSLEIPVKFVRP